MGVCAQLEMAGKAVRTGATRTSLPGFGDKENNGCDRICDNDCTGEKLLICTHIHTHIYTQRRTHTPSVA